MSISGMDTTRGFAIDGGRARKRALALLEERFAALPGTAFRVVVAHHTPCYDCHYCKHENFSMCKVFKSSNLDPGGFAQFLRIPAAHETAIAAALERARSSTRRKIVTHEAPLIAADSSNSLWICSIDVML